MSRPQGPANVYSTLQTTLLRLQQIPAMRDRLHLRHSQSWHQDSDGTSEHLHCGVGELQAHDFAVLHQQPCQEGADDSTDFLQSRGTPTMEHDPVTVKLEK